MLLLVLLLIGGVEPNPGPAPFPQPVNSASFLASPEPSGFNHSDGGATSVPSPSFVPSMINSLPGQQHSHVPSHHTHGHGHSGGLLEEPSHSQPHPAAAGCSSCGGSRAEVSGDAILGDAGTTIGQVAQEPVSYAMHPAIEALLENPAETAPIDSYNESVEFEATPDDADDVSSAGPGTAASYAARLEEPLYPKSRITLGCHIYARLVMQYERSLSDEAANEMFWYEANVLLPEGNICPPSLYVAQKAAGFKDVEQFEEHFCPCDRHRYPKISKAQWQTHANDKCPLENCGRRRFETTQGGHLKPAKVSTLFT